LGKSGIPLSPSVNRNAAASRRESERAFLRAVVTGLADLAAGRELSLDRVKARLRVG